MTADQQSKSILVLDDPVTSFDDGRIDRTIRLIEAMRNRFRQLIILSHYPKYLKSFFQRAYSSDGNIKLLKIVSDSEGSHFQLASSTDFVETEHYIKFKNIIGFIDRTHQNDVQLDLRIYLETEVRLRYRMQIEQNNLLNIQFGDLVAQLFTLEIITQDTREEIDSLRQSLNVDHHVWTSRAHEEKIGIASDTINFIYSRL